MQNLINYTSLVSPEMPIDYLPVLPIKKPKIKKLQFATAIDYKRISETSNYQHLSISYNAYKQENKITSSTNEPTKRKIKDFTLQNRFLYNLNQLRHKPTEKVETFLFEKNSDKTATLQANFGIDNFTNNFWLNTPGPIYTTPIINNNNVGKLLAANNIASDKNDATIIFKQPLTQQEADLILLTVTVNDGDGFCVDGNNFWNQTNILAWWAKSEQRINYIMDAYKNELFTPTTANSINKLPNQRPIPTNYKLWLDFYKYQMKQYLEWYILKLENIVVVLPELHIDWSLKEKLDKILNTKFLSNLS